MDITEIEQHIRKVVQNDDSINSLLMACVEDALNTKYTLNGYLVERKKEDIIISAIGKAKMFMNNCADNVSLNFKGVNINQYIPLKMELFNEWSLLDKAFNIAKSANDADFNFFDEYSEYMTDVGERTVDYCGYTIPVDEDNYLFIDFIDFGLHSYHIEKG